MKSFSTIFLKFITLLLLCSCSISNTEKITENHTPKSLNISEVKTLFLGANSATSSVRSVELKSSVLYKIDTNGLISPVEFYDDNMNIVPLAISSITKKSKNYIAINAFAENVQYNLLLDTETGKLFNLGNTDTRYCISPILGTKEIVYSDMNSGTVSKLNLNTLTVTPLNNPSFDFISGYFWFFENQTNAVFAFPQPDNFIIVNDISKGPFKLDLNGVTPPQQNISSFYGYPLNTAYPDGLDLSTRLPLFANDKSVFSFETIGKNLDVYKNGSFVETLYGATTSDDNILLNTPVAFAYDFDDYYIYKSGLLFITMNDTGSLTYNFVAKDLSFLFETGAVYYKYKNTVYSINGNVFKYANPISDNAYTILYTSPKTLNKSWMMNENIYLTL